MSFRFYFLFLVATFFLLFYPGGSPYFKIIAFNRDVFSAESIQPSIQIKPIPQLNPNTQPPIVSAQGVFVVDEESFTPMYGKNLHTRFYPASTTKIVTALVARDIHGTDDVITVKKTQDEGQVMGLIPNERITVENLLYGMLVYSGNDAAQAFADDYGYDAFITRMNEKAHAIGMKDSTFKNPSGLDQQGQMTTPFDLALGGRELLRDPYLRKIVGTKEITISDVDYKIFHRLSNVNKLLGEIQGLGGLKTGYTENAGENLVSFYRHNGHDFIIVVMKSEDRFLDTRTLVNWIDMNVTYKTPFTEPDTHP